MFASPSHSSSGASYPSAHQNRTTSAATHIRGVMLLPLNAKSYRQQMAHYSFISKVNSGTRIRDPRQDFTRLVEDKVRFEMEQHLATTPSRVLRWEQKNWNNRYTVRFRELDGVFETTMGSNVILEVKASASKGCLRSGLEQLRTAVQTARHAKANTIGILVIANLGKWLDIFGKPPAQPLNEYFAGKDVDILDWPPHVPAGKISGIYVCIVPDETLCEWLPADSLQDPISTTLNATQPQQLAEAESSESKNSMEHTYTRTSHPAPTPIALALKRCLESITAATDMITNNSTSNLTQLVSTGLRVGVTT